MKIKQMVNQTIESGITPIRLDYQPVVMFESRKQIVRTTLVIESLDLGTLTYDDYRYVARRTKQGEWLTLRHIEKLFRAVSQTENRSFIECYTFPAPVKLLKNGQLADMLFMGFTNFPEVTPNLICVEFSADMLYEDGEKLQEGMQKLNALGVKVAINEVGDEYCPVFKLTQFPFNHAFLDKSLMTDLESEKQSKLVGSIVNILHCFNAKVFAPCLENQGQTQLLETLEFDGYVRFSNPIEEEVRDGQ